jgi:hypothetical protein
MGSYRSTIIVLSGPVGFLGIGILQDRPISHRKLVLALESSVNQVIRPLRTWTFSSCIRGLTLWSKQPAFRKVRSSVHNRHSRDTVYCSRRSGASSVADSIPFGESLRDGLATELVDAGRVCRIEGVKMEGGGMDALKERLKPRLDENAASLWLEKWLQIHAGGHPTVFFGLYRLLRTRKALSRAVTPDTQLVIEGFPRSSNSFARRAFIMAQDERFDVKRIAHHLHVPAQVVRAAQWQIPTLVLIRRPRDAVLSLVIRDPISIDQALRYYISFYETAEKYRDSYVLGLFEEVTEDFGQVIKRLNDKFGTTFSLFRHDEENVSKVFAGMETQARRKYGERLSERKVQRPAAVREKIKDKIEYDLENPKRKKLIARAEAVYDRLTNPMREPAPRA